MSETGVGATGGVQTEIPDAIAGPEKMGGEGCSMASTIPSGAVALASNGATDGFHRLMMGTIHLHARAFDDAVEEAAGCNGDAVRNCTAGVCCRCSRDIVHLGWEVLIERPPQATFMVCMPPQIASVGIWLRMASRTNRAQNWTAVRRRSESGIVEILRRGRVKIWAASREQQPVDACEEAPTR